MEAPCSAPCLWSPAAQRSQSRALLTGLPLHLGVLLGRRGVRAEPRQPRPVRQPHRHLHSLASSSNPWQALRSGGDVHRRRDAELRLAAPTGTVSVHDGFPDTRNRAAHERSGELHDLGTLAGEPCDHRALLGLGHGRRQQRFPTPERPAAPADCGRGANSAALRELERPAQLALRMSLGRDDDLGRAGLQLLPHRRDHDGRRALTCTAGRAGA